MPSKADTFSVRLPDEVKTQLDELAIMTKRSRSYLVQEAVLAYVKDRAAYLQEIDQAVASAQSGIGHSGEKIFSWMESWGTQSEQPSPEPDFKPA